MQLVSNDSRRDDSSECEPILSQSDNPQRLSEASSSCEITAVLGDIAVTDVESQNLDVNESSKLVNSEQPQCRICLDNEGPYFLEILLYLVYLWILLFERIQLVWINKCVIRSQSSVCVSIYICFLGLSFEYLRVYVFVYFSGEDLIAPCHCRGTQKYVHRSCLDNWRSTKVSISFLIADSFVICRCFIQNACL